MNTRINKTKTKFATKCFRMTSVASFVMLVACSSGEPYGDKRADVNADNKGAKTLDSSKVESALVATIISSKPHTKTQTGAGHQTKTNEEKKIYEHDIESNISLKLFDLDWAKYELKREALANYVAKELKNVKTNTQSVSNSVVVTLQPPMPPRLEAFDPFTDAYSSMNVSQTQPTIGSDKAKIEISVFCNYQSIHCARMAKTYGRLNQTYPDKIKFVYYDFPQKFHRYSAIAAQATRCADQNNQLTHYQSALWASQNDLKQERLTQLAKQLGIPEKAFSECMSKEQIKDSIKANMQLANDTGFSSVPVTLVNGLYLNGPKSFDDFRYYIDRELERTKDFIRDRKFEQNDVPTTNATTQQANMQTEPTESNLALRLEQVFFSNNENEKGSVDIRLLDSDLLKNVKEDDEIMEQVYLVLIEAERVIIENRGRLEILSLSHPIATARQDEEDRDVVIVDEALAANDEQKTESRAITSKYQQIPEDVLEQEVEYKARPIVASSGTLPLSKSWVEQQLQNQNALSTGFQPAAHEVEGKHLLKLKGVSENEFYQTLGLKEGDAVMRVNGEWVHEQHNNLFDVLENEDHLSIVVMRKGLPVHLEYAIR